MSRMYVVNEWTNAAAHPGEIIGDRLKKSEGLHFNRDGSANTDLYADEPKQKKPSIHIRDRILPQQKRVKTLTQQMRDLVKEYKTGSIDIDEYSMLLSVLAAKRNRAEQLLAKVKSVRAPFETLDEHIEHNENKPNCLGKTHVNGDKRDRTIKGSACSAFAFKDTKKPSNSYSLSKVEDWINNHQFTYFVVCSTIVLTAAKLIF